MKQRPTTGQTPVARRRAPSCARCLLRASFRASVGPRAGIERTMVEAEGREADSGSDGGGSAGGNGSGGGRAQAIDAVGASERSKFGRWPCRGGVMQRKREGHTGYGIRAGHRCCGSVRAIEVRLMALLVRRPREECVRCAVHRASFGFEIRIRGGRSAATRRRAGRTKIRNRACYLLRNCGVFPSGEAVMQRGSK